MSKDGVFLARELFVGLAELIALNPEAAAFVSRRIGNAFSSIENRERADREDERARAHARGVTPADY